MPPIMTAGIAVPAITRNGEDGSRNVAWRSSELPVTSPGWARKACFSRCARHASTCAGG